MKNKQITKLVDQLMKTSFKEDGEVMSDKINEHVKTLKDLPIPQSIMALSEYMRRIKSEVQKSTLTIESVVPLLPVEVKSIVSAIKADHQVNDIQSIINPSLLGGIKVRIGDVIYDDSITNKILQLGEEIRD